MDSFTEGYIEAAFWASTDDQGEPLDRKYTSADLAPETIARMTADCEKFQTEDSELLEDWPQRSDYAGHDFWLTRNGHGAGFWDRYMESESFPKFHTYDKGKLKVLGEKLAEASHKFGDFDLYVGDDGRIYGQ